MIILYNWHTLNWSRKEKLLCIIYFLSLSRIRNCFWICQTSHLEWLTQFQTSSFSSCFFIMSSTRAIFQAFLKHVVEFVRLLHKTATKAVEIKTKTSTEKKFCRVESLRIRSHHAAHAAASMRTERREVVAWSSKESEEIEKRLKAFECGVAVWARARGDWLQFFHVAIIYIITKFVFTTRECARRLELVLSW